MLENFMPLRYCCCYWQWWSHASFCLLNNSFPFTHFYRSHWTHVPYLNCVFCYEIRYKICRYCYSSNSPSSLDSSLYGLYFPSPIVLDLWLLIYAVIQASYHKLSAGLWLNGTSVIAVINAYNLVDSICFLLKIVTSPYTGSFSNAQLKARNFFSSAICSIYVVYLCMS
jgi:hypothetical protein